MKLTVAYDLLPKRPSTNASVVMDHFGIDFETGRHVVADGLELPVAAGNVMLFTGPSGSGKSSLMRAVAGNVGYASGVPSVSHDSTHDTPEAYPTVNADDLDLGTNILVDGLDLPTAESIPLLTACGLGEPRLMLRTPGELSDGQRYRFRLAVALSQNPGWVVADEFTATLDRTLARVVAFNVRRLATRRGVGFLLATTHDDVTADLAPDLHVRCDLDGEMTWTRPHENTTSDSPTTSSSRPARDATGRTSLGGITEATGSGS